MKWCPKYFSVTFYQLHSALHFLKLDSFLKIITLLVGFIWPEKILVIDELLVLAIDPVFMLVLEADVRFYYQDFCKCLLFPVTVFGRFNFYTFTMLIYFLISYLLMSFGILKLVLVYTVIVFDFESFRPSYRQVFVFLNVNASFCLIFYSSNKNMLFRFTIFYI